MTANSPVVYTTCETILDQFTGCEVVFTAGKNAALYNIIIFIHDIFFLYMSFGKFSYFIFCLTAYISKKTNKFWKLEIGCNVRNRIMEPLMVWYRGQLGLLVNLEAQSTEVCTSQMDQKFVRNCILFHF